MKFICTTRWEHSGRRSYEQEAVYTFSEKEAQELAALDPKRPLGALSFFTPVDEEAKAFVEQLPGANPAKKAGKKEKEV
jgi:hypothetical protein